MKRLFVLIAAVLSCGLASAQNTGNQNYIEVNGKAEMEVVPDEIYIAITINEKDNKGKVSIDQQEKAMFRSLKSLGIDLETDSMDDGYSYPNIRTFSVGLSITF